MTLIMYLSYSLYILCVVTNFLTENISAVVTWFELETQLARRSLKLNVSIGQKPAARLLSQLLLSQLLLSLSQMLCSISAKHDSEPELCCVKRI